MDRALRLVAGGDLKPQDMAVLWCLASAIDRQTGECVRRYGTIAEACGVSRATIVRAIARLKAADVIEIRERYFGTRRGKVATAFRLGGLSQAQASSQLNRGSVHQCTGNSPSRVFHIPDGGPGQQNWSQAVDWSELETWLAKAGRYAARWGYGAEGLAAEDLQRLRQEKGDTRLLRAIEIAKAKGLFGEVLCDFLENTWGAPGRRTA
jgi:DNA-binding transcriptional MocR family regulator